MTESPTPNIVPPPGLGREFLQDEQMPEVAALGSAHVAEPIPQLNFLVARRTDVYQPIVRVLFEARQEVAPRSTRRRRGRSGSLVHAIAHRSSRLGRSVRGRLTKS